MPTTIKLNGISIPIHLIRKRKRHLSFRFLDTTLQVSAPLRATWIEIETGLRSKSDWILTHYAQQLALELPPNQIRLFGTIATVRHQLGEALSASWDGSTLTVTRKAHQTPQSALNQALSALAESTISGIFEKACQKTQRRPQSLTLKNLKSSLGRCSSTGHIILARRLVHYPPEVILAVCYHELAHLSQMNHSRRFYDLLEGWMPHYRSVMKNARNFPSVSTID